MDWSELILPYTNRTARSCRSRTSLKHNPILDQSSIHCITSFGYNTVYKISLKYSSKQCICIFRIRHLEPIGLSPLTLVSLGTRISCILFLSLILKQNGNVRYGYVNREQSIRGMGAV